MKIVIAPDSFKESLSAPRVARAIEAGFREIWPDADCVRIPVADGGEGTVEAMIAATGGRVVNVSVTGPLGDPVAAFFGLIDDDRTAIIEMAAASGLTLIEPGARNPLKTTTHGVGELILAALDAGARHIIVGIGGSATNDGGAGMAQALGARLLDRNGWAIGFGGGALAGLATIDVTGLDPRLSACRIDVACDVTNPLTGPTGASAVFGPQKGATPAMVAQLDASLERLSECLLRDLGVAVRDLKGGGAAGGLGAGLHAFLGAVLQPGIDIVMRATGLERHIADADLVVTGEGRIDGQTVNGKTPVGVAGLAKRFGKPVVALAGSLGADADVVHDHGLDAIFSVLCRPCSLDEALVEAERNLQRTARNLAAAIRLGGRLT